MKKQFTALFLLAALTVTILAGCQSGNNIAPINEEPLLTPAAYVPAPVNQGDQVILISAPHAENIALTYAGVKAEEATLERTELDRDDPTLHYEVEFRAGDYEYDYEINAATGEILKADREYDPETVPTQPPTEPSQSTEVTLLTAQQAEVIALEHASLTTAEVHHLHAELDYGDTVLHYDVEFRAGHYEYDYEIDAVTGAILTWERDYDSEKVPSEPSVPTEPAPAQPVTEDRITAQQAEAIALAHSGLKAEDVVFDRTELDDDHGTAEYEVEFRQGRWEYSYEIDARTGQILEWEKEYDD